MSKTFLSDGDTIDYTNTGSAKVSGELVAVGNQVCIAETDLAATTGTGALIREGSHRVTKKTTDVIVQGNELYLDVSEKYLTLTPTGNIYAGIADEDAGNGDTTVAFKICYALPTGQSPTANIGLLAIVALEIYAGNHTAFAAQLKVDDVVTVLDLTGPAVLTGTVVSDGVYPTIATYTPGTGDLSIATRALV